MVDRALGAAAHDGPDHDGALPAAVAAVQAGDVLALAGLLRGRPQLAVAQVSGPAGERRTLLHVATDWPGRRPRVAEVISLLVEAGADPDARFVGAHRETPLHWAASCDDVDAIDALLDAGADPDADGGVIAGGTPLTDATAFGQWRAAARLVERGATAGLWEAACLGLLGRLAELVEGMPPAASAPAASAPAAVTSAFWGACHGGQLAAAQYLLASGADPAWVGYDGLTPLQAARRGGASDVVHWLTEGRTT